MKTLSPTQLHNNIFKSITRKLGLKMSSWECFSAPLQQYSNRSGTRTDSRRCTFYALMLSFLYLVPHGHLRPRPRCLRHCSGIKREGWFKPWQRTGTRHDARKTAASLLWWGGNRKVKKIYKQILSDPAHSSWCQDGLVSCHSWAFAPALIKTKAVKSHSIRFHHYTHFYIFFFPFLCPQGLSISRDFE